MLKSPYNDAWANTDVGCEALCRCQGLDPGEGFLMVPRNQGIAREHDGGKDAHLAGRSTDFGRDEPTSAKVIAFPGRQG